MTNSTIPPNKPYPEYTRTFAEVYLAELDYIKERRGKIDIPSNSVKEEYERVCKELDGEEECKRKWVYQKSQEISQTGVLGFLERFRFWLFVLVGLLLSVATAWHLKELTIWIGFVLIVAWILWLILLKPLFLAIAEENKSSHPKIKISTKANLVGLALSGGGVRSATFNLGLLQSLAKNKVLQCCDYLSTVSGGGYIGSCMTSLLANDKDASTKPDQFPLRNWDDGNEEQIEVNYLRKTKNYLGFGRGLFSLETWQNMGTILTGFLLMMTIPLAIILLVVLGLWLLPETAKPSFNALTLSAIIGVVGLLWIMLIRLRQVSLFWERLWIILIPLLFPLILPVLLIFDMVLNSPFVAIIIGIIGFLWVIFFHPRQISVWEKLTGIIITLLFVLLVVNEQPYLIDKWGLLLLLFSLFWVLLIWNMFKRISQIQSSGYYSYELRRQHDKRIGWRLAVLCGFIILITLGDFIYKYADELNTLPETNLIVVITFVLIGSILVIMVGRFLNIFQKAQEKLMSIVVSIALVILFSAVFSLLLAGLTIGKSQIEELYYKSSLGLSLIPLVMVYEEVYGNLPFKHCEHPQEEITQFTESESQNECQKEALDKDEKELLLKMHELQNKYEKYKGLIKDKAKLLNNYEEYKALIQDKAKFEEKFVDNINDEEKLLNNQEWQEMRDIINKINNPWFNLEHFSYWGKFIESKEKDNFINKFNKWKLSVENMQQYQQVCSDKKDIIEEIYCDPFVDGEIFKGYLERTISKKSDFASSTIKILVGIIVVILIIMGLFINLNYNSLHYFYRTRLSNTYLIKRIKKDGEKEEGKKEEVIENKPLLLKDIHEYYNGPYHLINTTLNVPSSTKSALSGRGADFFIFSKYYCGAESTGYKRTDCYRKGYTKLATAMAISGAAASPEMGTSTNPGMAALMSLLNIRLNLWLLNPNRKQRPKIIIWPYYLFKELLRKSEENDTLLNLSDGGHHENLGIYPLLKRRCKLIIASDAGADPNYQMEDLANLQRKARIDLGINIEIDLMDLRPDDQTCYTKAYFAKGTIHYPGGEQGTLFYIKTTMTGNESEDLLGYQRKHPDFPDETTADQFFNEDQFESYRKLGEWIGERFYFETVVEKDKRVDIGLGIFAINAQKLKAIVESLKIGDLENIIVSMDNPVTFYPQREEEAGLGEPFLNLVQKFVKENRSHLVETIRKWLCRKTHQNLLWFAGEVTGYFKLSELRDKLRSFCRIIDEPDKERCDWELSCLWAYSRFNDYEQIHELLHKTTTANTQKWLLTVYTQMVTTHPEEGKHQCFIDEVNKFLGREIQGDVRTKALSVVKQLEIQKAIYELLQKTEDEETKEWWLTFHTQVATAHREERQEFISELNQFLQCSGIPNDVKEEIKRVIELLENIPETGELS